MSDAVRYKCKHASIQGVKKEALRKLHLSIGINHAIIEDPLLLMSLGIPLLWLWVPRLIAAAAAVWLSSLFFFIKHSYAH